MTELRARRIRARLVGRGLSSKIAKKSVSDARAAWFFAAPMVVVFIAFVVVPVINTIYLSFFHDNLLTGVDSYIGIANYRNAVTATNAGTVVINTAIWTVGSLVGQIVVGLVAALIVNRQLRFIGFFRSILIMPYVIPAIALALIWRWMSDGHYGVVSHLLQTTGLIPQGQSPLTMSSTAMLALVIANIWRGFPFAMLVYWAALQSIDQSLYDAAAMDGASGWQRFRYVTLRALRSTTVALIVLRGIWTATYFDLIWLVTQGGPGHQTTTWTILIYNAAIGSSEMGFAAALGVIMAVVLMVVMVTYVLVDSEDK